VHAVALPTASVSAMRFLSLLLVLNLFVILFQLVEPTYTAQLKPSSINHDEGNGYWARISPQFPSPIVAVSDDLDNPFRSNLRLFENDRALGPPNARHAYIRREGGGAYSFWRGGLLFSSSDNSDPRVNERTYRASVPLGLSLTGWLALFAFNAIGLVASRRQIPLFLYFTMFGVRATVHIVTDTLTSIGGRIEQRLPDRVRRQIELWRYAASHSHSATRLRATADATDAAARAVRLLLMLSLRNFSRKWSSASFAWRSEIIVVVLIAGLPILGLYLLGLDDFIFAEISYSTFPMKQLAIRAMAGGELPLWTSALGAGLPMLADGISLPYDPRNLWWSVLDPLSAYAAALTTSRCIFMVVCYLYFRIRLGFSRGPALAATCVYFCGTLFVMEVSYAHLATGLETVPMMVWLGERLLDEPGLRRATYYTLGWFVVLLVTSVAYFIFTPVLVGSYAFMLWWFRRGSNLTGRPIAFACWFIGANIWGIALFAFAALPFFEMASLSNRGAEYMSDPFALRSLWGLVVGPGLYRFSLVNPPFAHFLYVGIVALPAIVVALHERYDERVKAVAWLACASLIGIVLMLTPFKAVVAQFLPIVNSFAFFRASYFWGFFAAVLVGYALQRQTWTPPLVARRLVRALIIAQLALASFVIVYSIITAIAFTELPEWRSAIEETNAFVLPVAVAKVILIFAAIRAFGLTFCFRSGRALRRTIVGTCLVVELIAFFAFYRLNTADPYPRTSEVQFLIRNVSLDYRLMEIDRFGGANDALPAPNDWSIWALHLNGPAWWLGLHSANAYNSLVPATYWSFIRTIGDRPAPWRGARGNVITEKGNSPLLPLIGVRWLIARFLLEPGPYKLVHRGEAYYVYEREDAMPRAYAVTHAIETPEAVTRQILSMVESKIAPAEMVRQVIFLRGSNLGPNRSAEDAAKETLAHWQAQSPAPKFVPAHITSDSGNRVTIEIDMSTSGWLVLTDNDFPGWYAAVNDTPTEIRRANLFARAVAIPPGRSTVVFEYHPRSLRYGAIVSALAGGLMLLSLIFYLWHDQRAKGLNTPCATKRRQMSS
jgi:hypothetical protein